MDTLDVSRPFTRVDALAAGITASQLKSRRYRRLLRGVYVAEADALHPLTSPRAALLVHPVGTVVSHHSAAALLGLPVPRSRFLHVTVPHPDDRRRHEPIRCHVAQEDERGRILDELVHLEDVAVTAPGALFPSLAHELDLVDLVVLGDAIVGRGLLTLDQLHERVRDVPHRCARARRAAAYVREEVDSPMETRLRMLVVLAGLPEPCVNAVVRREDGSIRYRFDLSWLEHRLILEYDGRQHAEDTRQWRGDLRRREWLDQHGYRVLVLTGEDVYRHPAETLERVRQALVDRCHPGVPTRLRPVWRDHFPGRS